MLTILHISDLHRSPSDPISNTALVASLTNDQRRHGKEYDAIIVSGDLIQGARLGDPDHQQVVHGQYAVAEEFLGELAERFLGSERGKLVMCPGNHDVDWNVARRAMAPVALANYPADVGRVISSPEKLFRWSWPERQLYRIADVELYRSRLDAYREFATRFYDGSDLVRAHDARKDHNLFEVAGGRVAIGAFNSCNWNDCYALHGAIHCDAIARAGLQLHGFGAYDLKIAVWHHSVDGSPYRTDYLDLSQISNMIDSGFRLGLHGHQHSADASTRQIRLPAQEEMAVVAAGSLCAGFGELPKGNDRQYNILEFDLDSASAAVFVREMAVGSAFGSARKPRLGGEDSVAVSWSKETNAVGQPVDVESSVTREAILAAEESFHAGYPKRVVKLVGKLTEPHARVLLLEALKRLDDARTTVETLAPRISTAAELFMLVHAYVHLLDFASAERVLADNASAVAVEGAQRRDLEEWIALRAGGQEGKAR